MNKNPQAGRRLLAASAMILGALAWQPAAAQAFPAKPVRLVVPFAPGGINDTVARVVGDKMAQELGQPVIVENRAGASGTVGAAYVAKSAPDGYTLLVSSTGPIVMAPSLYKNLGYKPQQDLVPIAQLSANPTVLVVHPDVPAKTLPELMALAKSSAGKLSYASVGSGTAPHLAAELFKSSAGLDIVHVPYKGGGPAVIDLLAGRVDMMFDAVSTFLPYVKAGKLRAIAVGSQIRSPALPQLPTMAETGLPGFEVASWVGLFAPAGTPPAAMERLTSAVTKAVANKQVQEAISAQGVIPSVSTPQAFAAAIATETPRWSSVIKQLGVTVD